MKVIQFSLGVAMLALAVVHVAVHARRLAVPFPDEFGALMVVASLAGLPAALIAVYRHRSLVIRVIQFSLGVAMLALAVVHVAVHARTFAVSFPDEFGALMVVASLVPGLPAALIAVYRRRQVGRLMVEMTESRAPEPKLHTFRLMRGGSFRLEGGWRRNASQAFGRDTPGARYDRLGAALVRSSPLRVFIVYGSAAYAFGSFIWWCHQAEVARGLTALAAAWDIGWAMYLLDTDPKVRATIQNASSAVGQARSA